MVNQTSQQFVSIKNPWAIKFHGSIIVWAYYIENLIFISDIICLDIFSEFSNGNTFWILDTASGDPIGLKQNIKL